MANNDILLIDGIMDEIVEKNDNKCERGQLFEKFVISEILKSYDLSDNEIESGIMDGKNDGGIDGFFIFVNGILVNSLVEKLPKTTIDLELFIITSKHADTFSMSPLESVDSTISELLNLNISDEKLRSEYNEKLLNKRVILGHCYKKLAARLEKFTINFIYASRGDVAKLQDARNLTLKGQKIIATCENLFSDCTPSIKYWGAKEIMESYRKKRNGEATLLTQKTFQQSDHFVLTAKLKDYYNFITDDAKKLKRYFFDENVRDFLGENRTNIDIAKTLQEEKSIDFWLLNNGVTILVSSAIQTDGSIIMEGVQIINGLQTSNSIFQYFSNGHTDDLNRSILIKVIKSDDIRVRNAIIQSTNNQSSIALYSLHATDKIQKDIEDYLFHNGLYYERKLKYYQNQGFDPNEIITPLYLAYGYTSLVLKLPHRAINLKQKFMGIPTQYQKVFNENQDLRVWLVVAQLQRLVEPYIERSKKIFGANEKSVVKHLRPLICFLIVSKNFKTFAYSAKDLIEVDLKVFTPKIVEEAILDVCDYYERLNRKNKTIKVFVIREVVNNLLIEVANKYSIQKIKSIIYRKDFVFNDYTIDKDFISMIKEKNLCLMEDGLPDIKYITEISEELGCSVDKVFRAIDIIKIDKGFVEKVISMLSEAFYKGRTNDIARALNCNVDKVNWAIKYEKEY